MNRIIITFKKYNIFFVITIMIVSLFFIFLSLKKIKPPPEVITRHKFSKLEMRVSEAVLKNQEKLIWSQLPVQEKKDGWGNIIQFRKVNSNMFEFLSYGEDGVPGNLSDLTYCFEVNIPS